MLTFGAQQEAVQTFVGANGVNLVPTPCQHLVDVSLVADVEYELIVRCVKNPMQSNRQFDYAEIGSEVTSRFRE
jgi:hypothetical protein